MDNNTMKLSPTGLRMLALLEGTELAVYPDEGGCPTIGIGHLLTRSELRSGKIILTNGHIIDYRSGGITSEEAYDLLSNDLARYEDCVRCYTGWKLLGQRRFDALVIFTFNVGRSAFRNSTLLQRVNAACYDAVPHEMRRWIYAGGKKSNGLAYRRERTIELFRDGMYYTG
jgi:lysozyme